jgi:hypothetical protein
LLRDVLWYEIIGREVDYDLAGLDLPASNNHVVSCDGGNIEPVGVWMFAYTVNNLSGYV